MPEINVTVNNTFSFSISVNTTKFEPGAHTQKVSVNGNFTIKGDGGKLGSTCWACYPDQNDPGKCTYKRYASHNTIDLPYGSNFIIGEGVSINVGDNQQCQCNANCES